MVSLWEILVDSVSKSSNGPTYIINISVLKLKYFWEFRIKVNATSWFIKKYYSQHLNGAKENVKVSCLTNVNNCDERLNEKFHEKCTSRYALGRMHATEISATSPSGLSKTMREWLKLPFWSQSGNRFVWVCVQLQFCLG